MKIAILLCILGAAIAIPTGQVAPSESNSPSGVVESAAPAEPMAKAISAAPAAPAAPLTQAQTNEIARQAAITAHNLAHTKALALHNAYLKELEELRKKNELLAKIHAMELSGGRFEATPLNLIPGLDTKGCLIGVSGKICPTGNVQFFV